VNTDGLGDEKSSQYIKWQRRLDKQRGQLKLLK